MSETQKNSGKRGGWWVPAAMIAVGTGLFVAVAADLHYRGWLARHNDAVSMAFHERSTPWGIMLFSGLSYLGDFKLVLAVALAVGVWLARGRRWRSLGIWAAALIGSAVINQALKAVFRAPRPGRWTYYVFEAGSGYSFPSGHTMAVGVTAGTLALIIMHHYLAPARTRWLLGFAVAALTMLVAFALLYMGVHTLTDVAGGLAVTLAWVGVLRWLLPPAGMSQKWRAV